MSNMRILGLQLQAVALRNVETPSVPARMTTVARLLSSQPRPGTARLLKLYAYADLLDTLNWKGCVGGVSLVYLSSLCRHYFSSLCIVVLANWSCEFPSLSFWSCRTRLACSL